MGKLISVTVPDRVHAAVVSKGAELEQGAAEFVKHLLMMATHPEGVLVKLELAPLAKGDAPLFVAAGLEPDADTEPK